MRADPPELRRRHVRARLRPSWIACLGCALLSAPACRPPQGDPASQAAAPTSTGAPLTVFVTIPPQAYFASRVGGDLVRVHTLVGVGQSPHTFEPTPRQVAELSGAQVYFTIGMPFEEPLVAKLRGASVRVVPTHAGIAVRTLTADEASGSHEHDHAEGEAHDHSHEAGQPDPHTWLDPRLAARQAQAMCAALCALKPDSAAAFEANLKALTNDLDALHERIATLLAPLKGREFYVFHPAYGYFADAYGLQQVAVERDGKEPGPRELAALIERARAAGTRIVFYQPQYSKATAETLARELHGTAVPLDPYAGDYLRDLEALAQHLERAIVTAEAQRTEHP